MAKNKKEGKVAKEIEDYTAEIPSDAYLWTAFGVMGVSLTFKLMQKKQSCPVCGPVGCSYSIDGCI